MIKNLIIRGHIRNSFANYDLKNLVRSIMNEFPEIKIYIHTWNVVQSSLSWRRIKEDSNIVTSQMIIDYFKIDHIKQIIIDDDSKLDIIGRVDGYVANTKCPILGYKYMFYGIMKISELVLQNSDPGDMVVQTRFDILKNWVKLQESDVLNFMNSEMYDDEPIKFIRRPGINKMERDLKMGKWMRRGGHYPREPLTTGCDNMTMSTVLDLYKFMNHMYSNFDEIEAKYKKFKHQEWLSMFEAFDTSWRLKKIF